MAIPTAVELDRSRIAELTAREEQRLNDSTKQSQQMYQRAMKSLSGGVASSYQLRDPWPIYLERGAGCRWVPAAAPFGRQLVDGVSAITAQAHLYLVL